MRAIIEAIAYRRVTDARVVHTITVCATIVVAHALHTIASVTAFADKTMGRGVGATTVAAWRKTVLIGTVDSTIVIVVDSVVTAVVFAV